MPYQPFLISDFRRGLEIDREPWASMQDSFRELVNGFPFRGQIRKRNGVDTLGHLVWDIGPPGGAMFSGGTPIPRESGTVTVATTTTLQDTSKTWIVNEWITEHWLVMKSGRGHGHQLLGITSNTSDTLTFATMLANFLPELGDEYVIYEILGVGAGAGRDLVLTPGTASHFYVIGPGTVDIEDGFTYAGAAAIFDDGNGVLTSTAAALPVGTVDYRAGIAILSIDAGDPVFDTTFGYTFDHDQIALIVTGNDGPSQASTIEENMTMWIGSLFDAGGTELLLAADRRYLFGYNGTDFIQIAGGSALPYFSVEPHQFIRSSQITDSALGEMLVFTNGIDPIYTYDGTTLRELHTDWTNPAAPAPLPPLASVPPYTRRISWAKLSFVYANRLVILNTMEEGQEHPQRFRWSQVLPTDTTAGNTFQPTDWMDAPTTDHIVSATMQGRDLVVWFENSVWRAVAQDDPLLPFFWEQISDEEGARAINGSISQEGLSITVGKGSLIATDRRSLQRFADSQIPDFVLNKWDQANARESNAIVDQQRKLSLFTFPAIGEPHPNVTLVMALEDKAFAEFDYPEMHVFGLFAQETDTLWDDLTEPWDETSRTFDDPTRQSGYPIVLGGDRYMRVSKLNVGTTQGRSPLDPDQDENIRFFLKSQKLNPFRDDNLKAKLGYVDIIANRAPSAAVLTMRLTRDYGGVGLVRTVDISQGSGEKIVRRIPVFLTAWLHQIEFEYSGIEDIRIDGFVLYFKPDGPKRSL